MLGDFVHFLHVLQCQLAGGDQNEDLDGLVVGVDGVDERDGAGAGFARAGFGQAHDVFLGDDMGYGLFLDGGHFLVAHFCESLEDVGG